MAGRSKVCAAPSVAVCIMGIVAGFYLNVLIFTLFSATSNININNFVDLKKTNTTIHSKESSTQNHHGFDLESPFAREYLTAWREMNARRLGETNRVLCWVRAEGYMHSARTIHVVKTWTRHCNTLVIFSDEHDDEFETIVIDEKAPWPTSRLAISYLHENFSSQFDWALKVEDDTYVIVENLRELLQHYSPQDVWLFNFRMTKKVPHMYRGRPLAYVLSAKAVETLATQFTKHSRECMEYNGREEDHLENCARAVGLKFGDLRDPRGGYRFIPFDMRTGINSTFEKKRDWWDWIHAYWPSKHAPYCCSSQAVSFHYVSPNMMYMFEYLIYHVGPTPLHMLPLDFENWSDNFEALAQHSSAKNNSNKDIGTVSRNKSKENHEESQFVHPDGTA